MSPFSRVLDPLCTSSWMVCPPSYLFLTPIVRLLGWCVRLLKGLWLPLYPFLDGVSAFSRVLTPFVPLLGWCVARVFDCPCTPSWMVCPPSLRSWLPLFHLGWCVCLYLRVLTPIAPFLDRVSAFPGFWLPLYPFLDGVRFPRSWLPLYPFLDGVSAFPKVRVRRVLTPTVSLSCVCQPSRRPCLPCLPLHLCLLRFVGWCVRLFRVLSPSSLPQSLVFFFSHCAPSVSNIGATYAQLRAWVGPQVGPMLGLCCSMLGSWGQCWGHLEPMLGQEQGVLF